MSEAGRVWQLRDPTLPKATIYFSELRQLTDAIRSDALRSAMAVVAPSRVLTFEAVEEITVAAQCSRRAVGVVPAEHADRLADISRPQHHQTGRWVLCDALRSDISGTPGPSMALADIFTDCWDILAFLGHGDGSHLNLGGSVLCGLYGEVEVVDGIPLHDGCRREPPRCKKQTSTPTLYQAARIRAHTIVLLSCTSMSLARQVYPSNVSLALASYANGAECVIGSTRQVQFSPEAIIEVLELLTRLPTVGDAVAALNEHRRIAEDGALVLLGDPETRPPAAAAMQACAAAREKWPRRIRTMGRSYTYLTVPAAALAADRRSAERVSALSGRTARLVMLERFLLGLRLLARPSRSDADPVYQALDRAELARRRCLELALRERIAICSGVTPDAKRFVATGRASSALADSMLALFHTRVLDESHSGAAVGDLVAPALTLFYDRAMPVELVERCGHCTGAIRLTTFKDPITDSLSRSRTSCSACGVLADTSLPLFRIEPMDEARPGTEVRFRLSVSESHHSSVPAVFQVRDKTRRQAFTLQDVEVANGTLIPFTIPETGGSDIWSARLVALVDGSVEYARCVFSVLSVLSPATPDDSEES